jgi:hypothetical protein
MFNNATDTAVIAPCADVIDEEERMLLCFVESTQAAQEFLSGVYAARSGRGAPCDALEADRDTLADLHDGYMRALARRRRELRALGGEVVGGRCRGKKVA